MPTGTGAAVPEPLPVTSAMTRFKFSSAHALPGLARTRSSASLIFWAISGGGIWGAPFRRAMTICKFITATGSLGLFLKLSNASRNPPQELRIIRQFRLTIHEIIQCHFELQDCGRITYLNLEIHFRSTVQIRSTIRIIGHQLLEFRVIQHFLISITQDAFFCCRISGWIEQVVQGLLKLINFGLRGAARSGGIHHGSECFC